MTTQTIKMKIKLYRKMIKSLNAYDKNLQAIEGDQLKLYRIQSACSPLRAYLESFMDEFQGEGTIGSKEATALYNKILKLESLIDLKFYDNDLYY